jgi:hypothetical protein
MKNSIECRKRGLRLIPATTHPQSPRFPPSFLYSIVRHLRQKQEKYHREENRMKKWMLFLMVGVLLLPMVSAGEEVGFFTNPLRILTNEVLQFDFITRIIVFIFSSAVAVIGAIAWARSKVKRVGFVALAFGLLAFKWLLKVMDLFVSGGQFFPDHAENVIELISLALIAYAIFVKPK